jgi:uncharacterized Fe-S cluster-containing radical SAM superfamily enzyme
MQQRTKFASWMAEKGYTYRQLADELDYSYEFIFSLAVGRRHPTLNVQLKFINRFGRQEAAKAFENSPLLAAMETA